MTPTPQDRAPTPDAVDFDVVYARTAIEDACRIIERGDERLLRIDGPCNNLPPDITLVEWRTMYVALDNARKRLWALAAVPPRAAEPDARGEPVAARHVQPDDQCSVCTSVRLRASRLAGAERDCWTCLDCGREFAPLVSNGCEIAFDAPCTCGKHDDMEEPNV